MCGYVRDQAYLNNAAWDGLGFRFGVTDPRIFSTFLNEDIINHEVGHAITDFSSRLIYQRQSGALNESISDVFALIRKHQKNRTKANQADADWGFAKIVNIGSNQLAYYRSFSKPGSAFKNHKFLGDDQQVSHTRDYRHEKSILPKDDFGGVHKYSGIPNHAFYLAATKLQGNVWETVGKIWCQAAMSVKQDADFASFAAKTIAVAKNLNYREPVLDAIQAAGHQVGVEPEKSNLIKYIAGGCLFLFASYQIYQHYYLSSLNKE